MRCKSKKGTKSDTVKPLKVEEITVKTVQYYELDRFVGEVLGIEYLCRDGEGGEWGNDSDHLITVDGELDPDERNEVDNWKSSGKDGPPHVRMVMNYLAAEGKLEKGTYLVQVCW